MSKSIKVKENTPLLQILQQIKDKTLSPHLVSKEMMTLIVGYLSLEGWTHPQIAQLFEFSEKQAQRAHREFEKMVQVATSLEFIRKKIGYFICASDNQAAALIRIARASGTAIPEKIAAESAAWKIRIDTVTVLQRLGVFPIQPQRIDANVFHHSAEFEQTPEEAMKLLENIEKEGKAAGVLDEEVRKKIKSIKVKIREVEISRDIAELKQTTEQEGENHEPESV
jgi:hypothetical protein